MNYDKVSYLFWAIIVFILILAASVMSNYGRSFINDKTFNMFFGWYSVLVLINLFTILLNLIYHYFMKDLQGPRGLKGEIGERGQTGKDDKCACAGQPAVSGDGYDIDDADDISTRIISFGDDNSGADYLVPVPSDSQIFGQTGSVIVKAQPTVPAGG
jgi:hypothetical protein